MTTKQEFLGQLPIFADLYEDDLRALAQICDEYEFDRESVIAYQRDVADRLYIVRNGRLFARSVDERGIARETRSFFAGDYFQDEWLFAADAHPATVRGGGDGRLLIIENSKFLGLLEKNRGLLDRLTPTYDDQDEIISGLSESAWEAAQKSRVRADKRSAAVSLLTDELVEFYARRSRWYLILRIIGPALGLLLFPLLAFAFITGEPGTAGATARLIAPMFLFFIFAIILGFQLLDWSNDYFVITNKHLVHREFELRRFRTNVNKIPIDQIQSVEIDRPTFLANLFNFGTARITTSAQNQALYFDNIDNPGRVEESLN
ncbi:MAG: cyclic nucleotide-binding domain-containing protein, partial [Anaerolineae bacterium]